MSEEQLVSIHLPAAVWRVGAFLLAIAVGVVVTFEWTRWEGRAGDQETDDAYIQADQTPLSARVTGYVRAVPVEDFQKVSAGQLIAEIADDDYRAAVAQGEANLAAVSAQIQALEAQLLLQSANHRAAQAVVASTKAALEQNERDVRRLATLLAAGSASIEAREKLGTAHAQLIAQLDQNGALAEAARRQRDVLSAQLAQARASQAAQDAALSLARLNLSYTRIVAPQDGIVGQRQVRPGQYLGVGGLVTVLTPPRVWVIANYRETQLTHVEVGQPAVIAIDTYPEHRLRGHVIALAPASGSQYALLPPDNATGNFTKVVQRLPVKIAIDDTDGLDGRLRPGMSVVATIDARENAAR